MFFCQFDFCSHVKSIHKKMENICTISVLLMTITSRKVAKFDSRAFEIASRPKSTSHLKLNITIPYTRNLCDLWFFFNRFYYKYFIFSLSVCWYIRLLWLFGARCRFIFRVFAITECQFALSGIFKKKKRQRNIRNSIYQITHKMAYQNPELEQKSIHKHNTTQL